MYNLFGEIKYLRKIIETNKMAADFLKKLLAEKKVAVWGAGMRAEKFAECYPEVGIECFIDSNKCGEMWHGIKVISLKEFKEAHFNTKIVILPRIVHSKIEKEIKESGIGESRILNFAAVMDQLYEDQYFDIPELRLGKVDVFVDGGSLDGSDSIKFYKMWGDKTQIWEPNPEAVSSIDKRLKENNIPYKLIQAGVSNEKEKAFLLKKKDEPSATFLELSQNGDNFLDCLDNHMDEKISMIKMDVEGFEEKALLGARGVIQRDHPILAICVYHKQEDIWEIHQLIHSMCPEYRFYLRHYSLFQNETVLYGRFIKIV